MQHLREKIKMSTDSQKKSFMKSCSLTVIMIIKQYILNAILKMILIKRE